MFFPANEPRSSGTSEIGWARPALVSHFVWCADAISNTAGAVGSGGAKHEPLELRRILRQEVAEGRLLPVVASELERVRRQELKHDHPPRRCALLHAAPEVEAAAGVDEVDGARRSFEGRGRAVFDE